MADHFTTVYMVQNNDGTVMAICRTRRRANGIAVDIGQHRWHEAWIVTPMILDECDAAMMCGSESYQRMQKKLEQRNVKNT